MSTAPSLVSRNEFILENSDLSHAEIADRLYKATGQYATPNAVNLVITRAKTAGDPRVQRKATRRGTKGQSPFNKVAVVYDARRGFHQAPSLHSRQGGISTECAEQKAAHVERSLVGEAIPATALRLIDTKSSHCKFPLQGSGISLVVCGADVGGFAPYCPACREKAYLPIVV